MSELISTIITTHRRPQLLKKAITSVLQQTYPYFQVCIYDNASGDETEEIVRELMKNDSRIKYHCHSTNIGMMANYQYALSHIDTPFFSLLSDDDYLLPCFYETALKGFEQFPDVALSACAVKAIAENGQFVSDPMRVWQRDGYFAPSEGVMEMITKPLLPCGVLFKHQLVKDISPDLSEEIQIRWDTDYLLHIFSRSPCVLNRKICAVFLTHTDGFSSGRYRQMQESAKKFNEHIKATERMMERAIVNPALSSDLRKKIENEFSAEIKNDYCKYINLYIEQKKFSEAVHALQMYSKKHKVDTQILLLLTKRWIYAYFPWFVPVAHKILHRYRGTRQWIKSQLNLKIG